LGHDFRDDYFRKEKRKVRAAELFELESLQGVTMADLLGPDASLRKRPAAAGGAATPSAPAAAPAPAGASPPTR
jgi:hypothetical protein